MQQLDDTYYHGQCAACFNKNRHSGDQLVRKIQIHGEANVFLCQQHFESEMEHRQWLDDLGIDMAGKIYGFFFPPPTYPHQSGITHRMDT